MGIFSDAGKFISQNKPIRQRAEEPGPYNFHILNANSDPAFENADGTQFGGWIEQIDNESPAGYEVSQRFAHATLYAFVPNTSDAMYRFQNAVLGWHVTAADFSHIKRTNPIQHPRYRNLWAYKVSEARGRRYTDRLSDISPASGGSMKGPTHYASYHHTLMAVEFKPNPTGFLMPELEEIEVRNPEDDTAYYHEGYRYLEYETRTNIYDVTIQTGQFAFQEGPNNDPKSKVFPGEINFLEVKQSFTLRWRLVPEDFVCDTTNFHLGRPRKLNTAAGKVNSKPFMGYPAGTMLMLEPDLDRYASGCLRASPAQAQAINGDGTIRQQVERPFQMCDVIIPLIHFDPPHFSENNRGHNLKPWRRDTTTAASTVLPWQVWRPEFVAPFMLEDPPAEPPVAPEPQMLYYLVKYTKADGTVTETKIYGEYDFNKCFQHWAFA